MSRFGGFHGGRAGAGLPGMANRGGGLMVDPAGKVTAGSKRSLAEWQMQNQYQALLMRSVKQRSSPQQQTSPISPLSPLSPELSTASSVSAGLSYGGGGYPLPPRAPPPAMAASAVKPFPSSTGGVVEPDPAKKMKNCLQELERQLLDDDDGDNDCGGGGSDGGALLSGISGTDLSETMQSLVGPPQPPPQKSLSPSSSSSSSSPSITTATPPPPSLKQQLQEAAVAMSEGQNEQARAILARFNQALPAMAGSGAEQKLAAYIAPALLFRIDHPFDPNPSAELPLVSPHMLYEASPCPNPSAELPLVSPHMLYEASPCFKLGFLAAGLAIVEATQNRSKIHVLDFDLVRIDQYLVLLQALSDRPKPSLRITAVSDATFGSHLPEPALRLVGDRLKAAADRVGVGFHFAVATPASAAGITREALGVEPDEALVVSFAYSLYRVPDESVSTVNLRDELLRRARRMLPAVVVVAEQELGTNTAPFPARLGGALDYYGSALESLDGPVQGADRVRVEEFLGRKAVNAVVGEGTNRVERCEPFGKWRARMSMAGLKPRLISGQIAESVRARFASSTKGNPSFFIKEEAGGLFLGWNGRPLTVVSAWH